MSCPPPLQLEMLSLLKPLWRFDVFLVDHSNCTLRAKRGSVGSFLFFQAIPKHINLVVEICFHAVFQLDSLPVGVGRDREIETPLVNNFVIVHISFPLVEKIHL